MLSSFKLQTIWVLYCDTFKDAAVEYTKASHICKGQGWRHLTGLYLCSSVHLYLVFLQSWVLIILILYLQLYQKESGRSWTKTSNSSLKFDSSDLHNVFIEMASQERHRKLSDFDDHLNDISRSVLCLLLASLAVCCAATRVPGKWAWRCSYKYAITYIAIGGAYVTASSSTMVCFRCTFAGIGATKIYSADSYRNGTKSLSRKAGSIYVTLVARADQQAQGWALAAWLEQQVVSCMQLEAHAL